MPERIIYPAIGLVWSLPTTALFAAMAAAPVGGSGGELVSSLGTFGLMVNAVVLVVKMVIDTRHGKQAHQLATAIERNNELKEEHRELIAEIKRLNGELREEREARYDEYRKTMRELRDADAARRLRGGDDVTD